MNEVNDELDTKWAVILGYDVVANKWAVWCFGPMCMMEMLVDYFRKDMAQIALIYADKCDVVHDSDMLPQPETLEERIDRTKRELRSFLGKERS